MNALLLFFSTARVGTKRRFASSSISRAPDESSVARRPESNESSVSRRPESNVSSGSRHPESNVLSGSRRPESDLSLSRRQDSVVSSVSHHSSSTSFGSFSQPISANTGLHFLIHYFCYLCVSTEYS